MNSRYTLLLLVVTGALFAYIVLVDNHRPNTRVQQMRDGFVLNFDPATVEAITIDGGAEKVELRREGVRWMMESPVRDLADPKVVSDLLNESASLRIESTLAGEEVAKEAWREFGLHKPKLRLELRDSGGAIAALWFGKETAVEGRGYVRREGEEKGYVVNNTLRELIGGRPDAFRDPRLSDMEAIHVERVALRSAVGEIEVVRDGKYWFLNKPLRTRAAEKPLTDLIHSLLATPILAFAPEQPGDLHGLGSPRMVVTLAASSRDEALQLELGNPKPTGAGEEPVIYARLNTRRAILELPQRIERLLLLRPNDLRDRRLLVLEPDLVDRITFQTPEAKPITLYRKGEVWFQMGDEVVIPADRIAGLFSAVLQQEVSDFVSNTATDLARYGLDQPTLRLTFSSYASATTAESGAGEEPIATLLFGKEEEGKLYAMIEGEPFILAVDPALLEAIGTEWTPWRALAVIAQLLGEVVELEVHYADRPAVLLQRSEGGWHLKEGQGVLEEVNLESFLEALTSLHALRWLPTPLVEGEAGKPVQRIIWKTAKGAQHELLLHRDPDGGEQLTLARLASQNQPFLLRGPDEAALRLPLVLNPAETPSPVPPGKP